MKTVFNNHELTHTFATQLQSHGRTPSGSLFFNEKTIYSYGYHFPIAKFISDDVVLFTEREYSNTTSKHKTYTRRALQHKTIIYCKNPEASISENFDHWENEIKKLSEKLTKAKKPELYTWQINSVIDKAKKYADIMEANLPLQLVEAQKIFNKETSKAFIDNLKKIQEKETKRKYKEQLKKFRSFETNYIYNSDGFDYIRKTAEYYETSQGVKIPISVGNTFYNILDKVKPGDKLLDFTVIEKTKEFIKIGCHKIKLSEIKKSVK